MDAKPPTVSIIVPCYNEQSTIRLLLEALYTQTYPLPKIEVLIADGQSTDGTREQIEAFVKFHEALTVRIVENPKRHIPAGLNRALEHARGRYIIRLDAHAVPDTRYVERCVKALQAGLGDNVGGVWDIQPSGPAWPARSIAAAASHPLGVGDARYRIGHKAQVVDTVPFGAFHRSVFDRVGRFDESLLTNEDYEFNVRLRKAKGRIWLDPQIRSVYFARPNFKSLAQQYWRYGYWKAKMLQRYPETLRWRQLSALLVVSFIILAVAGIFSPIFLWLLALETFLYASALIVAGVQMAIKSRDLPLAAGAPIAIAIMHFSWGLGFIFSLLRGS